MVWSSARVICKTILVIVFSLALYIRQKRAYLYLMICVDCCNTANQLDFDCKDHCCNLKLCWGIFCSTKFTCRPANATILLLLFQDCTSTLAACICPQIETLRQVKRTHNIGVEVRSCFILTKRTHTPQTKWYYQTSGFIISSQSC